VGLGSAARLREKAQRGEISLRVHPVVVAETVWVLATGYRVARRDIAGLIERLLEGREFEFEHHDLVMRALHQYRSGKADFADYLIGEVNRQHGCSKTLTFDTALRGSQSLEVL
jgi:predicted nucleic-acid-binding protein